jgi:hypothetical protein
MITRAQYHEAIKVESLQMNIGFWENRRKNDSDPDYQKNINAMIKYYEGELEKLTGNKRGFLNG